MERLDVTETEGGVAEKVTVTTERTMPVEEILRRLQAVEDDQARRLKNYLALNTTHLRFQAGTNAQSVETTFKGPYFFEQGKGFDWVWQEFMINGIKWKKKTIPEIPMIQPEKATSVPIEISFTKEYAYTLRGTGSVEDRDCWVIDFKPLEAVEEASSRACRPPPTSSPGPAAHPPPTPASRLTHDPNIRPGARCQERT